MTRGNIVAVVEWTGPTLGGGKYQCYEPAPNDLVVVREDDYPHRLLECRRRDVTESTNQPLTISQNLARMTQFVER